MRVLSKPFLLLFAATLVAVAGCTTAVDCCPSEEQPAADTRPGESPPAETPPAEPDKASPPEADPPRPALAVTYLGNEGFLVSDGGRGVVVDGFFGSGIPGYQVVPPPLREELETGGAAGIDVALATHFHGDHFAAEPVVRFLRNRPSARFVSTPQAVALLEAATDDPAILDRVTAVLPAEGTIETLEYFGITIEVLNLHHGRRTPPVENLGFIVTFGGERFLHFGDTEAKMEDFAPYLDHLAGTELALLPFWFLSSEWRAAMVRDRIAPARVIAAHLPTRDAPAGHFGRWGNYEGLRAAMLEAFPEAQIADLPGTRLD